jgi:hypothetical protein
MSNTMNVQNTRPAGQVVSLPSVDKKVYYQTYANTLFGLLSYQGQNTDVVKMYAGRDSLPKTAISRKSLPKGVYGLSAQVRKITGQATFGDKKAYATNPLEYGDIEYAVNKITSPEVPVRGEMARMEMETFIDDTDNEIKTALTNWFVSYLDHAMVQTVLNGASVNLLAPRDMGGLRFQFTGRATAGVPQMNRNVWYAATNAGTDTMLSLDWEIIHGAGFNDFEWNRATQSVIEQIAFSTGDTACLTRNKLDNIGLFTSDNHFSAANVIDATTNHILIVSPREVVALRRSIDDKIRVSVDTLLNQLSFYGFREGFLYNGILVIGHPIMDAVKPRVIGGAIPSNFQAPQFGGGLYAEDWTNYRARPQDTVGVGILLGRDSMVVTDAGAIKSKGKKDGYDELIAIKQELMFGAVRTEFTQVSLNERPVDMRDRTAVYNDSSAMVLFKSANI